MSDGRAVQSREVAEPAQASKAETIDWFGRNWDALSRTSYVQAGVMVGRMDDILPKVEFISLPVSIAVDGGTMTVDAKTGAASLMSEDGQRRVFSYSPAGADDRFEWKKNVLSKIVTPTQTFTYDADKALWLVKNEPSFSPAAYDSQSKVHCAHFKSGEVEKTFELSGAVTIERLAASYKQFVDEARVINAYLTPEKKAELQDHFKLREDECPSAYLDSRRIPTVGIGFNLIKSGARERIAEVGADYDTIVRDASCPIAKKQVQLSKEQITALFQKDLLDATKDAVSLYPDLTAHPPKVQDVLVDLSFNMGASKLSEFERFNAAIKRHRYSEAASYLAASKYAEQTGTRAEANIAALKECGDH